MRAEPVGHGVREKGARQYLLEAEHLLCLLSRGETEAMNIEVTGPKSCSQEGAELGLESGSL